MSNTTFIKPYILLEITDNKETMDFLEFYFRNKKFIYLALIETFKGFTNKTYMDTLRLSIRVITDKKEPLLSHFDITINDKYVLNELLMPYFIQTSEFEVCEKIKIINQKLNRLTGPV